MTKYRNCDWSQIVQHIGLLGFSSVSTAQDFLVLISRFLMSMSECYKYFIQSQRREEDDGLANKKEAIYLCLPVNL